MSFWSINIPQDSNWGWKKILNLRSTVKPLLKYEVGSSCSIFLWHDWWNPDGVLTQKNGTWVIYDAASDQMKGYQEFWKKNCFWKPVRWDGLVWCIYYSKLYWCIKVLKTFQIEPGTYSSAESLEYIRAKLLLLVHQSPKKLSITCRYANHGPKSSSENE